VTSERLGYNRLCNLEDFSHPELEGLIRSIFAHELVQFGQSFPRGYEYRKYWEVAMAMRALDDFGTLHDGAEILGVAAGREASIFWLTSKVRRVFATDLYLDPGEWKHTADAGMLVDPGQYWPGAWNPRRLVVQHMNALDLQYEDASFDGIFSSSSIEHFGDFEDVQRAMKEMFRVLKPGGVLTVSTEFRLEGPSPGLPGILMFDPDELQRYVIGDLAWSLLAPLDLTLSLETRRQEVLFADAAADVRAGRPRWSSYPHIVLRDGDLVFTSIHLALQRSTDAGPFTAVGPSAKSERDPAVISVRPSRASSTSSQSDPPGGDLKVMTSWRRPMVRFLRPAAARWRQFMAAELRADLAEIKSKILKLEPSARDRGATAADRPNPVDVNLLLHHSRSALLRSMPKDAGTLVSVGCAGSWYFEWFERCYGHPPQHIGIEYYGAPPAPADLPDNVTWIANTAAHMPDVLDGTCDLLFSGQNIEHLWPEEVSGFLAEAARVVRPGGHLVIDSPNRALTAALNWSHPEHTIELTPEEASHLVSLAGFDVTRVAGIWLCRDPASSRLLSFDPNVEDPEWSLAERLLYALEAPADSFIWWLEAQRAARPAARGELETTMQEIFATAWPERTKRMVVGIGQMEQRTDADWVVCPLGESGAVLYGPYMPLRPGRYRCTFSISVPEKHCSLAVAKCDVVVADAKESIVECEIFSTHTSAVRDVNLEFSLPRVSFGVQFRCISYGTTVFACRREVGLTSVA
jgi:ubiquinone/menaquinone biosynthesis C-methylase UbiE